MINGCEIANIILHCYTLRRKNGEEGIFMNKERLINLVYMLSCYYLGLTGKILIDKSFGVDKKLSSVYIYGLNEALDHYSENDKINKYIVGNAYILWDFERKGFVKIISELYNFFHNEKRHVNSFTDNPEYPAYITRFKLKKDVINNNLIYSVFSECNNWNYTDSFREYFKLNNESLYI